MPTYEIVTPLRNGGKNPIPPGDTIEMSEDAARGLVGCGALKLATAQKPEKAKDEVPAKPLEEQSLEELKSTAKAERVPRYGLIKDEAKLREAIVAHRAKSQG